MPLKRNDREALRHRLTWEFLVKRTAIFHPHPGEGVKFDKATVEGIIMRFKAYWENWVEDDLKELFEVRDANKTAQDLGITKARLDELTVEIDKILNHLKK